MNNKPTEWEIKLWSKIATALAVQNLSIQDYKAFERTIKYMQEQAEKALNQG